MIGGRKLQFTNLAMINLILLQVLKSAPSPGSISESTPEVTAAIPEAAPAAVPVAVPEAAPVPESVPVPEAAPVLEAAPVSEAVHVPLLKASPEDVLEAAPVDLEAAPAAAPEAASEADALEVESTSESDLAASPADPTQGSGSSTVSEGVTEGGSAPAAEDASGSIQSDGQSEIPPLAGKR
jgi:hypothetical protein